MALRKFVAGNWKMHGTSSDLEEVRAIAAAASGYPGVDVALCLPSILIERAVRAVPGFAIGGQDVHFAEKGAHTGSVSTHMLLDAGAKLTIVGHSERRDAHRESNDEVRAKAELALSCGLHVILCVGESLEVRQSGRAVPFVTEQLAASLPSTIGLAGALSVAYEPIWAIGTGEVASCADIAEIHSALRTALQARFGAEGAVVRILYGGSVKASNAAEIFATRDVDGALVGGASLQAADFIPIIASAAEQR
jgi:triosephosphate isomerase